MVTDHRTTDLLKRVLLKEMDPMMSGVYLQRVLEYTRKDTLFSMYDVLLDKEPKEELLSIAAITRIKDLYEKSSFVHHNPLTVDNVYLAAVGIVKMDSAIKFGSLPFIERLLELHEHLPPFSCGLSDRLPELAELNITAEMLLEAAHDDVKMAEVVEAIDVSEDEVIDAASVMSSPVEGHEDCLGMDNHLSNESIDIQHIDMLSVFEERLMAAEELADEVARLQKRLKTAEERIKELT